MSDLMQWFLIIENRAFALNEDILCLGYSKDKKDANQYLNAIREAVLSRNKL